MNRKTNNCSKRITSSRHYINKYKSDLRSAIEQVEFCNYETFTGSPLENNIAYIALKETIDESLRNEDMDFGLAIKRLKEGKRVQRAGWNGVGVSLELQIPDANSKMTQPYIYIDTLSLQTINPYAIKGRIPWIASQTDILAEDWRVVE